MLKNYYSCFCTNECYWHCCCHVVNELDVHHLLHVPLHSLHLLQGVKKRMGNNKKIKSSVFVVVFDEHFIKIKLHKHITTLNIIKEKTYLNCLVNTYNCPNR